MDRRGFLQLLGAGVAGIALEQAIPLGRVWSFPKEIVLARPTTVRFIKAWDIYERRRMCRFDVLYGWKPHAVGGIENYGAVEISRHSQIQDALDYLAREFGVEAPPAMVFQPPNPDDDCPQVYGVTFVDRPAARRASKRYS